MKLELSFPQKIIALVIVVVVLPLAYVVTNYFSQGYVAVSSSVPKTVVTDITGDETYTAPAKVLGRTGKRRLKFEAPGYVTQEKEVRFPSFRRTTPLAVTLKKKFYDVNDPSYRDKVPLGRDLPYEDVNFIIDFPKEDGMYAITLYATLNSVAQYDRYQKELTEFANQALSWIKQKGVAPEKLEIEWSPQKPDGITVGRSAAE